MKIRNINIEALEITEAPRLDPIRVYLQDYGNKQGRLTVECFGLAWACYWQAMGTDLRSFLIGADAEYLEGALHSGQKPKKAEREYLRRIIKAIQSALLLPAG